METTGTVQRADAIVVGYRSEGVIEACLSSLRADPGVDRIILVNNSPGDGTERAVASIPGLVYLNSRENLGFGRAVNSARPYLTNEFVVLANPDTVQTSDTVASLLRFLADHQNAGLVGPRMVYGGGKLYLNSQHSLMLHRMIFEALGWPQLLRIVRTPSAHMRPHLTEYVIGSFVAGRRRALDAIDWFDESIFLFGEDQDLCRRLRSAGWEVWFAPVGHVTHLSGHSWRQLSDRGHEQFRQARYRELRVGRGRLEAGLYKRLVAIRNRWQSVNRGRAY